MAALAAKMAVNGSHTAGIYADMTVDGPEIGTLVVIVDRAKNLPNRKTMGKQNPYCAARLGKEAKKTETDVRGGQVPKWDQEMRFTVHDSPDYYQLKVSVFNDDKKTELIGETWVALETIVVPGGGANDIWHTLNCKGRYAGEVRIELTYYDTRPREEMAEERHQSAPANGSPAQGGDGVNGPRQPKPVKRRPLPADPTGSTRSSPLPHTPPPNSQPLSNSQQRYIESPDNNPVNTPPQDTRYFHQQSSQSRGSPSHGPRTHDQPMTAASLYSQSNPHSVDIYDPVSGIDYRQGGNVVWSESPHNAPTYNQSPNFDQQFEEANHDPGYDAQENNYPINSLPPSASSTQYPRPLTHPSRISNGVVRSHSNANSSPVAMNGQQEYQRSSLSKSHSYDDYSIDPRLQDIVDGPWQDANVNKMDDEEAPPAPPVHRNSGAGSSAEAKSRRESEPYSSIPPTAPLNIRNDRASISGSPLSQVQSNAAYTAYQPSISPTNKRPYTRPVASVSTRNSHIQLDRRRSQSPIRNYDHNMPPSLVPGYEGSIAGDESERMVHEQRVTAQQAHAPQPMPLYQQEDPPNAQARAQPVTPNLENIQGRKPHRSSAPVAINRRAVGPDPRTPSRKSVSPQPRGVAVERQPSQLPFSPDSYDTFNPSIGAANSVNEMGATYNTPEEIKEASFQHERATKLGDGPIIGNDGRVIDPSDHLPTDTWAPEPEQKKSRKGPEVTVRFRHSPQGAQPMPPSTRRPLGEARAHSTSTPVYTHSSPDINVSPTSAHQVRLQQKSLAAMTQTASSPIVPTLKTTTVPNSMPRSTTATYPLPEREHCGYGNSSPTYGNRSPGGIPPPVPGKVPIGAGQEDWGMSALSEEMRRIDIGVGGGQRPRKTRYGA